MQSVKAKDGNILTEEEDVINRWRESYQELYNIKNPYNIDILKSIPKCTNSDEEPCILREEVAKAIKQFKEGKAPGYDSITAEELKAPGDPGIDALHLLCEKNLEHWTYSSGLGESGDNAYLQKER